MIISQGLHLERKSRPIARRPAQPAFSLTNALTVFPERIERSDIVVRDGMIHRIDAIHAANSRRVDCGGDYLFPGLIEIHTDNLERHIEPRPGIFWSTDRAVLSHDAELAAAGITTVFDAITIGGETSEGARQSAYLDAISSIESAESQSLLRTEHHLHLRCELGSPNLPEYLRSAIERRVPRLMSLMEHVPGQGQWLDITRFRDHHAGRYGLDAGELERLIERRKADQARFSVSNRAEVLRLARGHGCLLASHDDAAAADVERARQSGCTICEFPTSIVAAREARKVGMHLIVGAPNLVRGGSHSGNVAAAELAAGALVDILSSDYCPSSLLQAVFCLSRIASVPLNVAVQAATAGPAQALTLQDRGSIAEGKRADLIRVRDTPRGPVLVSAWCAGRQVA